jgi:hypothetical protein
VLGEVLGTVLGEELGAVLGLVLGLVLGAVLGEVLGASLGDVLGLVLGEEMGKLLGDELGTLLGLVLGEVLGEVGPEEGALLNSAESMASKKDEVGPDAGTAERVGDACGEPEVPVEGATVGPEEGALLTIGVLVGLEEDWVEGAATGSTARKRDDIGPELGKSFEGSLGCGVFGDLPGLSLIGLLGLPTGDELLSLGGAVGAHFATLTMAHSDEAPTSL